MYTPGEIRAAEEMLDHISKIVGFPTPFQEAAKVAAEVILRHRADYDTEGMPLPVDEAFCKSLGMVESEDPTGPLWTLRSHIDIEWFSRSENAYIDGAQIECPTRPQLRALIEVMGC